MRKFDLIVFDIAGTTVRDLNEVEYCFQHVASKTGLNVLPERIISMMGWSKRLVFETLWNEQMNGCPMDEIESQIEISYQLFKEILEHHYQTQEVVPVENCLEVFAKIKDEGIKIALTTGFYRKVTDIILSRLGWNEGLNDTYIQVENGLIDCSVSSDEVSLGRPAPFMIYRAMELLRITDVSRVIDIGDTPSDLLSGHYSRVGLNLGVSYGTHTHEQLQQYPNHGIIHSINQLLEHL